MVETSEHLVELIDILKSLDCPLIIRPENWWIEELLFKPGKPRTDLLLWIITKATNDPFGSQEIDLTINSTGSVSHRLPSYDKDIFRLLSKTNWCKDLSFIEGNLVNDKQLEHWYNLIKPLRHKNNPNVNGERAFNIKINKEVDSNLNNLFTMSANLLPADVQSETQQFKHHDCHLKKDNGHLQETDKRCDERFREILIEHSCRLKSTAEKFISVSNDMKMSLPRIEATGEMIEVGDGLAVIATKCSNWKDGVDSLLDQQRRTVLLDFTQRRAEGLLGRCMKDESFEPFNNIREQEH